MIFVIFSSSFVLNKYCVIAIGIAIITETKPTIDVINNGIVSISCSICFDSGPGYDILSTVHAGTMEDKDR